MRRVAMRLPNDHDDLPFASGKAAGTVGSIVRLGVRLPTMIQGTATLLHSSFCKTMR
jgi:hypothetical protein